MRLDELARSRVALIGFGREGQAMEAALCRHHPAARVHVFAERAPAHAPETWPLSIGPLDFDPAGFDCVLRSPGVPVDHPQLKRCRAMGLPVTTPSSIWFAERPDARTIAVTGSKGKSTTSALIAHLLSDCGVQVRLAGNIGLPLIGLLDDPADWFVIELSSYQLVDLVGRPGVGAITRLFPEHADWHGTTEAYYAAKLRLLELLGGHPLWINGTDPVLSDRVSGRTGVKLANTPPGLNAAPDGLYEGSRDDRERVFAASDWALPGRHNLDNLALAMAIVESIEPDRERHLRSRLLRSASTFKGLSHRLETVASTGPSTGRLRFVNDSIATTPFATCAALESISGPVVLIAGGLERGGDWGGVIARLREAPLRALVVLPDNGQRIATELIGAGVIADEQVVSASNLREAVARAVEMADPESTVLLSPGAPSFPRFRDFEDRGQQFRDAVRAVGVTETE